MSVHTRTEGSQGHDLRSAAAVRQACAVAGRWELAGRAAAGLQQIDLAAMTPVSSVRTIDEEARRTLDYGCMEMDR